MSTKTNRNVGIIILALVLIASNLSAATVEWRPNIQLAASESASSGKPMLIKFSTEWCGYCKKMSRETFTNRQVASHIANCFVPVEVDGDQHRDLVRRLGIRSYPTTVVVSPKMEVVTQIKGFRTARQLTADLRGLCEHSTKTPEKAPRPTKSRKAIPSVFGDYCPASPIEHATLSKGDKQYQLNHRGFELTFASAALRDAFQENPNRYWPAIDGYCVISAVDESKLKLGNLQQGLLYMGRPWFFASAEHREKFRSRPEYYYEQLRAMYEQQPQRANR